MCGAELVELCDVWAELVELCDVWRELVELCDVWGRVGGIVQTVCAISSEFRRFK